jgi:hypothetical protein
VRKAHPVFFNTTHSDPGRSVNCPQSAERSFRREDIERAKRRRESSRGDETRDETKLQSEIRDIESL